jgi:hypothetical protein
MSGHVQVEKGAYDNARSALALFEQLWGDPEVGATVRKKAKALNPAISIPEDHPIIKDRDSRLEALEKTLHEYKAGVENEKAEAALRKQLGEVQSKFGFTDETMATVVQTMVDKSIADPEAAALKVRESLPKPKPTSASSQWLDNRPNLFGTQKADERWEQLHTDPDSFFADTVDEILKEMPPGT